jgi:hypothetical protein
MLHRRLHPELALLGRTRHVLHRPFHQQRGDQLLQWHHRSILCAPHAGREDGQCTHDRSQAHSVSAWLYYQCCATSDSRYLLSYPIAYCIMTLPLMVSGVMIVTGTSPPLWFSVFATCILALDGAIDTILFFVTRRSFLRNATRSLAGPQSTVDTYPLEGIRVSRHKFNDVDGQVTTRTECSLDLTRDGFPKEIPFGEVQARDMATVKPDHTASEFSPL